MGKRPQGDSNPTASASESAPEALPSLEELPASVASLGAVSPDVSGVGSSAQLPEHDPLEMALADAAKAGRWDVVAQLARELEARRLAGAPNVVVLDTAKRARS